MVPGISGFTYASRANIIPLSVEFGIFAKESKGKCLASFEISISRKPPAIDMTLRTYPVVRSCRYGLCPIYYLNNCAHQEIDLFLFTPKQQKVYHIFCSFSPTCRWPSFSWLIAFALKIRSMFLRIIQYFSNNYLAFNF